MEIITQPDAMRAWTRQARRDGQTIALVPTMGYFHAGHLSLMRFAAARAQRLVVSLFVNPTQFAPGEDLEITPETGNATPSWPPTAGWMCCSAPSRRLCTRRISGPR